nr:hypothetical protein BaRGS_001331 [Batillaria attramentaria]
MGLCHKNNLKDYWAETSSLTSTPEFGTYMSRNRFSQLRSNLHFNNNELRRKRGHPDYDPLYKVRPIIDAVMPTYLENYVPNREVSVDECMGKFRGRVFFRQYIPRKSCTYGMKVWCLNDAVTSMCLNWRVYIGEKAKDHTLGLSAEVLLDLCRPIYDTSRVCFQDMHFTSPTLALKMKEHGLGSCGTVRHDHVGMPDAIKNNKLKLQKGDPPAFLGHGQTGMLVASWQDVKRVNILSTVHKNNVVGCSGGRSRNLQKPQMCADYNKFSGGVDRMDQVMGYYQDKHRNKKHYMAVFQFAKEVALHNGYLLYKETRDHPVNPKKFREIIITQLLESYISSGKFINPKKRRRLTQEDTTPRRIAEFNPRHYLDYNGKRNDCVVCSDRRNGQRKSSVYWCPGCAVHLCLPRPDTNCFYRYHTLKNYKV